MRQDRSVGLGRRGNPKRRRQEVDEEGGAADALGGLRRGQGLSLGLRPRWGGRGGALPQGRGHGGGPGGCLLGDCGFGRGGHHGIDLMGGPATLLEAILLERGEKIFHVPGIAVNRARDAYPGESKSDARDARVIADQLRLRRGSLQEIRPRNEVVAEMRVLTAYRRDLPQDQIRRAARLREVLLGVFPGLEAALDLKREGALLAVTKAATPAAARKLGAT